MTEILHEAVRRPRLLLGAGGGMAIVSFFALTWIDLLLIRSTGLELARSTSLAGGKTALLWVVVAAAVAAIASVVHTRRPLAVIAGLLSVAGIAVLLYGSVVAAQGIEFLGRRFSLLSYLGIGYWSALAGLALVTVGAYGAARRSPEGTIWELSPAG